MEQPHGLEAYGFAAGVRAGDEQQVFFPREADVEGYDFGVFPRFPVVLGQGEAQQGVGGVFPLQDGVGRYGGGHGGFDAEGEAGCRAGEVDGGQKAVVFGYLGQHRADGVGECGQDAYDFPLLLVLQFADAVVGFHHFGRLDEDGLAGGRLVVYDAAQFALERRGHGQDQAAVAQGGGGVFLHDAFALGGAEYGVELAGDGVERARFLASYAGQFGGSVVADVPVGIEQEVDLADDGAHVGQIRGERMEARVEEVVLVLAFLAREEPDNADQGFERPAQVEDFRLRQVEPFGADAPQGLAGVAEVLAGKFVVGRLEDSDEFPDLPEASGDESVVGGETEFIHPAFPEGAQAVSREQASYFCKSYLLFEICRVCHKKVQALFGKSGRGFP